ncbi:radical SAM protein [Thermithiobacillus plumbiphilus]|uniref:Radical SAM protein n=1 Tax=Thermithiobacillus plumbiphilus TaxID=1729899 RepID=A0ABU9D9P3_9PROT
MREALDRCEHRREYAGLTYVYTVLSRRAGGISVGVNLTPRNTCNWRCIYCQVPHLQRGGAQPADPDRLAEELRWILRELLRGGLMADLAPEGKGIIQDIALAGNGEPTTSPNFDVAVSKIVEVMTEFELIGRVKLRLLTNGSLITRLKVRRALEEMAQVNGEVWFKVDSVNRAGVRHINGINQAVVRMDKNLRIAARLCPTWLQTCLFAWDGQPPPLRETQAYLGFVKRLREQGVPLEGVHLYGVARPVQQPESPRIAPLPMSWVQQFADQIQSLGMRVRTSF